MRKKTRLTIASFIIGLSMFATTTIKAEASETKNEAKTEKKASDYQGLLEQKQTAEYGTPEQLEGVHTNTMTFIKQIAKQASESAQERGIYASVTIAQAIVESGNGESGLARHPYNNLFGVKGSYNGNSIATQTGEDDGSGNWYTINSHFAVYPDWATSIEAHDDLLAYGLDGFYHGTWKENTSSFREAAMFLQERYASDTVYGSKLISVIERYNLTRFDSKLDNRDIIWLNSESMDPWERPVDPTANKHIDKQLDEAAKVLIPKRPTIRIEALDELDVRKPNIDDVKRIKNTIDNFANIKYERPEQYIIFNDLITA